MIKSNVYGEKKNFILRLENTHKRISDVSIVITTCNYWESKLTGIFELINWGDVDYGGKRNVGDTLRGYTW